MSATIRYEAEAKYPCLTAVGFDSKAWAKRIVYRFRKGAKDLLHIQIVFAHQALELEIPSSTTQGAES